MPRHHECRHLPHSAAQMYDLVADVARYNEFLPWVIATRIRQNSDSEMVADMIVGFKALRETFTSRVIKTPQSAIDIEYIDGPMKHLQNSWKFLDDPAGGSTVEFTVDFAFKNAIFEALAGQFFESALRKMTGAFVARADQIYADVGSNNPKA